MYAALHASARYAPRIVSLIWLTIVVFYLGNAFRTQRTVRRQSTSSRWLQAGLCILGFVFLFSSVAHTGIFGWRILPRSLVIINLGLLLTLAGCALAIWARLVLGRNWSASVTVKQDHILTTRGPYAFVRHPIYSGLLLAALGAAIVHGAVADLLALCLIFAGFWIKSHTEESFMLQEFGQQYTAYKQRVKALVPGLL
ncbi:MAG TPA: isoprenylcysteine carboxylmethyltransferase family protein [Acidobacteriaceae bacterium]|jgi:protein-S-isoprenylcysteine O-methyltransferase Ste14|nr:isoprenylcysteine carboxylmethyltransferase family protein [Acidobacteriaceae bacterium]